MFKKIKSFYNKDDFNLFEGYIDPLEFHYTFYRILVAFKVADLGNNNPPSYVNQNAFLFVNGLIATLMCFVSFCHGLETFDLSHMTEAGSYAIILSYMSLILFCTKKNIPQFHNLIRALKEDFHHICTVGQKYRVPYFENQLQTWKMCLFGCTFCFITPIGMNIFSVLSLGYFLATRDADTVENRPLWFPYWLPNIDFGKSPIYEIAYVYANMFALLYSYNFIFMFQTQIVWIRQITSKVDIIKWSLRDLLLDIHPATDKKETQYFSHLIDTRMRDIVIHHQSMYRLIEDYAIVYRKLLLFEQTICSPLVCLTAYCVAEKLEEGEFQAILLMICIATAILHFVPSSMCTYLSSEVISICDACWSIPFWKASPVIRPYMVLIMQRSLRPLPLRAPGFKDVSLETFSQLMTTAYSMFNMLRQTNL